MILQYRIPGTVYLFPVGTPASALEHAIPEQMFVTPENPGEAVSAVKALQKAAAQGQEGVQNSVSA